MIFTDIIALIVVYIYVAVIFVIAEMVLKTNLKFHVNSCILW